MISCIFTFYWHFNEVYALTTTTGDNPTKDTAKHFNRIDLNGTHPDHHRTTLWWLFCIDVFIKIMNKKTYFYFCLKCNILLRRGASKTQSTHGYDHRSIDRAATFFFVLVWEIDECLFLLTLFVMCMMFHSVHWIDVCLKPLCDNATCVVSSWKRHFSPFRIE